MPKSETFYLFWVASLVILALVNVASFHVLIWTKKNRHAELWELESGAETMFTPRGRMLYSELRKNKPKWVSADNTAMAWYRLFIWTRRFYLITFIFPTAFILLVYFGGR